jgi:hypothetical protein
MGWLHAWMHGRCLYVRLACLRRFDISTSQILSSESKPVSPAEGGAGDGEAARRPRGDSQHVAVGRPPARGRAPRARAPQQPARTGALAAGFIPCCFSLSSESAAIIYFDKSVQKCF